MPGAAKRSLAAVAYGVSAWRCFCTPSGERVAAVPAPLGMRLLTYTFVALVVPLAAVTRGRPGRAARCGPRRSRPSLSRRLHLSQLHRGDAAWPIELVGHHASLPLAFAILYQDYPFALADLFLKRALSLLTIVAVVFGVIATFGDHSTSFARFVRTRSAAGRHAGHAVGGHGSMYPSSAEPSCGSSIRSSCVGPTTERCARPSPARVQAHHDVPTLLSESVRLLAPALSADSMTWREWRPRDADEPSARPSSKGRRRPPCAGRLRLLPARGDRPRSTSTSVVTVPTSEPSAVCAGGRAAHGGRRFCLR